MRVVYQIPSEIELCSGTYRRDGDDVIMSTMAISEDVQKCIAAVTFILGTQALLLNLVVIRYYKDKKEGVFPVYYSIISLCNVFLGIDALFHTILLATYVSLTDEQHPSNHEEEEEKLLNYMIFITYTLTTTARNSKIIYNTILIFMRAVKYCTPYHVFSRRNSAVAVLLFPIFWMLFLAGSLNFQFSLPAEINMQQYIYFTEPNSDRWLTVTSAVLLYFLPLFLILTSLGVCLYKQRQLHLGGISLLKMRAKENKLTVVEPSYGQRKGTDVAMTMLLLFCTLPYVVLILIKIFFHDHSRDERLECTVLFTTGIVLPFVNTAYEPLILIFYNTEITSRVALLFRAVKTRIRSSTVRRSRVEDQDHVTKPRDNGRNGSVCLVKWRAQPDVIEYKDDEVESDSSLESFEYRACKHKSRRYR